MKGRAKRKKCMEGKSPRGKKNKTRLEMKGLESDKGNGSLGTAGTTQFQVSVEFRYWMQ